MKPLNRFKGLTSGLNLPGTHIIWLLWLAVSVVLVVGFIYLEDRVWFWTEVFLLVPLSLWLSVGQFKQAKTKFDQSVSYGRLESIVTNLEDAVVAYDANFKILIFNSAAERMFGLNRERILGQVVGPEQASEKTLKLLVQTLFPSLAPAVVTRTEPDKYPQVVDISFSGPTREFRVSTDRVLNKQGKLLGFVKVIKDRTREISLIKSKSEFVSVAAHQLRTPLTAISWTLDSLNKNAKLPEKEMELVKNGAQAASNLLNTVNDLLDTAEIEEGKFGYQFKEVDLVGFTERILSNAQIVAKKYGLGLFFDKGGLQTVVVKVDETKLGLALSNLVDNAMKYNSKNGSVTVSLKQLTDKPHVQISVRDTGIGMSEKDVESVFKKFFRAANARKVKADGSGLGLYITKNIVEQHGGSIWVESTLGRGTTFFFTIPTDQNLVPQAEVPVSA